MLLRTSLVLLAVVLLAACSCGSDDAPSTAVSGPSSSPVVVTDGTAATAAGGAGQPGASGPSPSAATPSAAGDGLDPATRAYVAAVNGRNLDALVEAFAPDGVVIDVSREFRGREAIRGWATREVIGGTLTVQEVRPYPRGTQMIVRFAPGGSGGFEACYTFDTAGGQITRADLQYRCP